MALGFLKKIESRNNGEPNFRKESGLTQISSYQGPIGPFYAGVKIEHISVESQTGTPLKSLDDEFRDSGTALGFPRKLPDSQRGIAKRLEYSQPRAYVLQSSQSTPHLMPGSGTKPRTFEEWQELDFITEGTEDIDELECITSVSQKVSKYLEKHKCSKSRIAASHGTSFLIEAPDLSAQKRSFSSFDDKTNVIIRKKGVQDSPVSNHSRGHINSMIRPVFHSDQANDSKRVIGLLHVSPSITPSKKLFFEDRIVVAEENAASQLGSHGNFSKVKMSDRLALF